MLVRIILLTIYITLFVACFAAMGNNESISYGIMASTSLVMIYLTSEKLLNNKK